MNIIPAVARLLGYRGRTETDEALRRIAARGMEIASVIDVGASDGRWSRMAERHWPTARFHLIEASAHWRSRLDELVGRKPAYSVTMAAAGPRDGETPFYRNGDPFGGAVSNRGDTVPMVSIDSEVRRLCLSPPFLIKLDTHGFEREILAGATETLPHTSLIVNEFYNFQAEDRRWPQMVALIEGMGFRCIDMMEPVWRSDGALWQMDFAFVRHDRPEFMSNEFTAPTRR